jgi:hypothetical protein
MIKTSIDKPERRKISEKLPGLPSETPEALEWLFRLNEWSAGNYIGHLINNFIRFTSLR